MRIEESMYMGMDDRKIQSFLQKQGGIYDTRSLLWQVIWVSHRFAQQEPFWNKCLKHMMSVSMLTIMTEVADILNSRSMTVEVLNGPPSLQPLLPVNIITMNHEIKGSFTTTMRTCQA